MSKYGIRIACLILTCLALAGCATGPSQGMYWDNYEQTLYTLQDEQDQRSRERHLATLRNIVEVSEGRGWRVPPGVFIELAVMERAMGNSALYAYYVNRERTLYPEAQPFIQRWFADVLPPVVVPEEPQTEESP